MSGYDCRACGRLTISGSCTCEPFEVWRADEERHTARRVCAKEHEEAATLWAARDDEMSSEYRIAGNCDSVDVIVARLRDGAEERWTVTGEMRPDYYARRR